MNSLKVTSQQDQKTAYESVINNDEDEFQHVPLQVFKVTESVKSFRRSETTKPIMKLTGNPGQRGRNISQEKRNTTRSDQLLSSKFKIKYRETIKDQVYLTYTQYQILMKSLNFSGDKECLKNSFDLIKFDHSLVHQKSVFNFLCFLQQFDHLVDVPRKLSDLVQKRSMGYIYKKVYFADKLESTRISKQY